MRPDDLNITKKIYFAKSIISIILVIIRKLILTNQLSISSNMLLNVWDVLLSLTQKQKETAFIYHHVSLRWLSEGRIGSVTHFGLHGSDSI